jgi:hypothetical protein
MVLDSQGWAEADVIHIEQLTDPVLQNIRFGVESKKKNSFKAIIVTGREGP